MCLSFWKMKHKFDILKNTKESTTKRRLYTNTSEHKTLKPSIFEYRHVADIVQKRLELIQNPKDCNNQKWVICELPSKGFGYQVHLLTICFTVGYFTNRTVMISTDVSKHSNTAWGEMLLPLSNTCTSPTNQTAAKVVFSVFGTDDIPVIKASFQTNYFDLQRTIPSYLTNVIDHFHSNPSLWWAGQIATFILRPSKNFNLLIEKSKAELGFQNITVGLLVQIKNKQTQAIHCNFNEYINLVEKWYMAYERKSGLSGIQRRIYIATDEPSVVEKAKQLYIL
ncbi:alpha-(1,6)-fucosyltransferase-like isoform X2 [Ruditapes philippinarum]|uniref:alpha-(1,6)-fucosyltransferase-like isoform X2 n=1 Tax=Ruditapes philippinarum TaxID=129788 RepID=UPI00295BE629|nr:alpha-(1,6)-fucosyltransferase-like isoform X2 [Ruditapes philippinarum]